MIDYTIKELAEISGIKAHTIRIWEQRYNLLNPSRTETNIRRYNDEDLKKLLNVSELIHRGIKISHIVNMTSAEIASEIESIITGAATPRQSRYETIVNQMVIALSTFDEVLFDKVFSEAITREGIVNTYTNVIYPMLVKTGLLWSQSQIMPAQEHFLSNLLRQKIFATIDYLPLPANPTQTWILFLGEEEEHELGLLLGNLIIRQCKQKVIYLGSKVPDENLAAVVAQCKPTHLYTFIVKNQPIEKIKQHILKLKTDFKSVQICVSGKEEYIGKKSPDRRITLIKDIKELTALAKK